MSKKLKDIKVGDKLYYAYHEYLGYKFIDGHQEFDNIEFLLGEFRVISSEKDPITKWDSADPWELLEGKHFYHTYDPKSSTYKLLPINNDAKLILSRINLSGNEHFDGDYVYTHISRNSDSESAQGSGSSMNLFTSKRSAIEFLESIRNKELTILNNKRLLVDHMSNKLAMIKNGTK